MSVWDVKRTRVGVPEATRG